MATKKNGSKEDLISVTVVATQAKRMRIGKEFTPEPQVVEVDEVELEALKADPKLVVSPAAVPAKLPKE